MDWKMPFDIVKIESIYDNTQNDLHTNGDDNKSPQTEEEVEKVKSSYESISPMVIPESPVYNNDAASPRYAFTSERIPREGEKEEKEEENKQSNTLLQVNKLP